MEHHFKVDIKLKFCMIKILYEWKLVKLLDYYGDPLLIKVAILFC